VRPSGRLDVTPGVAPARLAKQEGTSRAAMSEHADGLVAAGGIAGIKDEDDPRSAALSLTHSGKASSARLCLPALTARYERSPLRVLATLCAGGRPSPALVKAVTRTMLAAYMLDLLGIGGDFGAAVDAEGGYEVFVELEPDAVA